MKPLQSQDIFGNWATVLLPINDDDTIDFSRLSEELDYLIAARPNGIYSHGTAGEFYNLSEAEFDRISQYLAQRCQTAGIPFQIGVSHMSPHISLERLKRILPLQPSAVQVILPDWSPPTLEEAALFLTRMATLADPIGIVLYNPPHAKRVLAPEEIGRLKQLIPTLVGVKVNDGDESWYERMNTSCRDLSVFIPGHHLATGYQRGAHGSYSNIACLHPRMTCDLHSALELQQRIIRFLGEYITPYLHEGFSPQAVDKLLAAIGHWTALGTRLRWPYRWIPASHAERLRPHARKLLPEFFDLDNP